MNVIGTRTLLQKEVRRFLRVPGQTVLQPLISTSLYFVVFGFTLGSRQDAIGDIPYATYIVPGLVFLGIANNAFLNSSSSFFITKIQGTIVDLLVAPLGPTELLIGFVAGAMVRGLLVGLLTWVAAMLFTGFHLAHVGGTVLFLALSAYVFAVLGLAAGVAARVAPRVAAARRRSSSPARMEVPWASSKAVLRSRAAVTTKESRLRIFSADESPGAGAAGVEVCARARAADERMRSESERKEIMVCEGGEKEGRGIKQTGRRDQARRHGRNDPNERAGSKRCYRRSGRLSPAGDHVPANADNGAN